MQAFKFSLYLAVPIGLYSFVAYYPAGLDYFINKVRSLHAQCAYTMCALRACCNAAAEMLQHCSAAVIAHTGWSRPSALH